MRFTTRPLALFALFLLVTAGAVAQIPRTISFQGVLADAQGVLLPDNTYTLTLSIYDQATGGTAIFSESQQVQVLRGVFNAIIGSTNPNGIPAGLDFNQQYWLGVQVNNGTELAPRTPFTSVPYALNAATAQVAVRAINADTAAWALNAQNAMLADTAIGVRGGHVASINGQQGAVEILGAGSTVVTRSGNQFIIRSTDTSGGGIRRIDNFDGSLVIDPPQGPYVNMFIRAEGIQTYHLRDQSVTTEKIAPMAITNPLLAPNSVTTDKIMDLTILTQDIGNNQVIASKIGTQGADSGFALMSDGTDTPIWADPILMNIPYSATVASPDTLWSMTNTGTGGAGGFNVLNAASTAAALTASTDGQGMAIHAEHTATTGTAAAIHGVTNSLDASAEAVTGLVTSTSPGGFSSAIRGINNGTGGLGIGVWGSQNGSGWGVYGYTPAGLGVYGATTTGVGVYATADSGMGVYASSSWGVAGRFDIGNVNSGATALTVNNAGLGTAGEFAVTNALDTATGLRVATAGTGWALEAIRGSSGIFTGNGAILGESSNGAGVVGFSNSSAGVIAASVTGSALEAVAFGGSSTAVNAQAIGAGGTALRAFSLSGPAAQFDVALPTATADAVTINNPGLGRSLDVNQTNAANTLPAIDVSSAGSGATLALTNSGTGQGLSVDLTNAGSSARGINVSVAGNGTAVFATSASGMGVWGITSAISAAGVLGDNTFGEAVVGRNRGGVGVGAVVGRNDSSGYGVRGFNTKTGIGVLGQAGISGGTGVAGRFENVNAASPGTALEVATNGTGWAATLTNTNATTSNGVQITTTAGAGGLALDVNNGAIAYSVDAGWTTGAVVDDAVLVLNAAGNAALPTAGVADGTTVWVVNNSGAAAGISNVTVGPYAIAAGRAQQFVFVTAISTTNWVPVQ